MIFTGGGKMLAVALALLACFVSVQSDPTWDTLRVTWGVNLFRAGVFAKVPQTETQAIKDGYVRLAGDCAGGKFMGNRYIKGSDYAIIMIYDVNGYVAGIQNGIPKRLIENVTLIAFSYDKMPTYQLDKVLEEDVYFQTTYFINPSKICDGGRTAKEFKDQGPGTDVFLQNGPDAFHNYHVPRFEKDAVGTPWVKGGCFRTMGVHYWYNTTENMTCADFVPFTPIYNRGKLTTFAFVNFGKFNFSKRFEYPPSSVFKMFMPTPVPKCVYEEFDSTGGFSSMHVYFTVRPWNIMC